MRFVFHVGLHKTGSTFLQANLGSNAEWLAQHGVFLANTERPKLLIRQREVLRRANNPNRTTPREDALLAVNRRLDRDARRAGAHTVLLSEENRLGPPLFADMKWGLLPAGFYPRAGDNLRRLTVGIDPRDITILLVQRDMEDWLRSLYLEGVQSLNVVDTLEDFRAKVDHASLNVQGLVARMSEALPDAELLVLDFADLRRDPRVVFNALLDACGVEARDYTFASEPKRVAISEAQAEELLVLARRAEIEGPTREISRARRRILDGA